MFRLEDEALKLVDLMHSVTEFPFISEYKKDNRSI